MKNKTQLIYRPAQLPFLERLVITWDFEFLIKSLWLTGYLLVTWEWDHNFWRTLDMGFYPSGSFE